MYERYYVVLIFQHLYAPCTHHFAKLRAGEHFRTFLNIKFCTKVSMMKINIETFLIKNHSVNKVY